MALVAPGEDILRAGWPLTRRAFRVFDPGCLEIFVRAGITPPLCILAIGTMGVYRSTLLPAASAKRTSYIGAARTVWICARQIMTDMRAYAFDTGKILGPVGTRSECVLPRGMTIDERSDAVTSAQINVEDKAMAGWTFQDLGCATVT